VTARVSWRRPDAAAIARFRTDAGRTTPAHGDLALLGPEPPAGYRENSGRMQLGHGNRDFAAAIAALQAWTMFALPWTQLVADGPPRAGQDVVLIARVYSLWWTCACRVTAVADHKSEGRFAFTYTALPAHVAAGAETFAVERDSTGAVWFAIRAHARPHLPASLCPPLFTAMQRRFVRQAGAAMAAAVARAREPGR
jgi:uncharacterized protein (UPF0548 family)